MENWMMDLLQLPTACQVEEVLPAHFMSQNFKLSTGENNLVSYSVDEMAIVASISEASAVVPPSASIDNAAVLVVETKGGKFSKDAQKIATMLHQHIPQYMIIGLTDGEKACVSIASKTVNAEGALEVDEHFISASFSPERLEELSQKFAFDALSKGDMSQLWDNYCKLIAELV